MIRRSKVGLIGRWLAAAALVVPGLAATSPPAGAVTQPNTPCWDEGLGTTCTGFNGGAAAAYADQYVFDSNPNYPEYFDDCTNFVSQALYAGDHSYIAREGDPGPDETVNDDTEWWWFPPSKDLAEGRTFSWSVANDLWTFENVPVTQYPRPFVADPYSDIITGSSFWNNDLAYGTFISNEYMSSGNEVPEDSYGDPVTMSPGDLMFYDWTYSGDQYGDGFFGNHVAMVVSGDGVDPTSGWSGALVDEHSTNNQAPGSNGGRKDAIWSLIPYNSQYAATTAGWQDNDDGYEASSSADAAGAAKSSAAPEAKASPASHRGPALATPSSLAAQQAYSGAEKTDGSVPASTAAAAEKAFQAAITSRQKIAVPPQYTPSSATDRPTQTALGKMKSVGETSVAAHFTGTELGKEKAELENDQTWEAESDVRPMGGGADGFHYAMIRRMSSTQIELRGTVRTWAKVAQVQHDGRLVTATPKNTLDVDSILTLSGKAWKVSSFNWTFAPGSQP